jgi:hypothetical protein
VDHGSGDENQPSPTTVEELEQRTVNEAPVVDDYVGAQNLEDLDENTEILDTSNTGLQNTDEESLAVAGAASPVDVDNLENGERDEQQESLSDTHEQPDDAMSEEGHEEDDGISDETSVSLDKPVDSSPPSIPAHGAHSPEDYAPADSTPAETPDSLGQPITERSEAPAVISASPAPMTVRCRMCGAVVATTSDHLSALAMPTVGRVVRHKPEAGLPGSQGSSAGLLHELTLAGSTIDVALFSTVRHAPPQSPPHGTDSETFFEVGLESEEVATVC